MSRRRSNFLADAPLERLGARRNDTDWLSTARERGQYLAVWKRRNLVSAGDPPEPVLLSWDVIAAHQPPADIVLLGHWRDAPCFAAGLDGETPPVLPGVFEEVRGLGHRMAPDQAALLAYARAMMVWHERHRFCGRCGTPTGSVEAGHVRCCPRCDAKHFPRVDPAIIVLVADQERCLLGRQASWPADRYSTIAGFVEPGESLEQAVRREVLEETGVRVDEVDYHSSQPWPFPSSLMLGFTAQPSSEEITLRDGELEDALWVSRDEIAAGRVLMPTAVSIAYRLIEDWFDAAPGRRLAMEAEGAPWIARPEA